MAWSGSQPTKATVTGEWIAPGGTGAAAPTGSVIFTLSGPLTDGVSAIIDPAPITATLAASGYAATISQVLWATGDSATIGTVYYNVLEQITGSPARSYQISVAATGAAQSLQALGPPAG